MTKSIKVQKILDILARLYPDPGTQLEFSSAWELLVATVLAAQCTDARVNMVTPVLFARWPGPAELALASQDELESVIHSTGFFRNKAKNLLACAKKLQAEYNGEVPKNMDDLVKLPGVARKTANVILFGAYDINVGIAVDTHVKRISGRLGLTQNTDPVKIEKDLMQCFPQNEWGNVNLRMVWFGRHVCTARNPACSTCQLQEICSHFKANGARTSAG